MTRRRLLSAALAAAALPRGAALAADDRLDLLIKGGTVVDPSQKLKAVRDVGIRVGRIDSIEEDIPKEAARGVIDAEGLLVVPGLVDLHTHVYPQGSAIGLPADELAPITGTTTYVSAGDAGANNFSALKHFVIAQSRSRIFAFLHISSIGLAGFPVGESRNADYLDVDLAARTLAENPEVLLGIKVRESRSVVGDMGIEPLRRALDAVQRSGTKSRVMCHIGDAPGELPALLDLLRPGDILTHVFSGAGNNVVVAKKVIPAALEAKQRGVILDVGHGGGSFDFGVAEAALEQGLLPDTISSDIHAVSANTPGLPYLPWVMSKFLHLGFGIEDVVRLTTAAPAAVIDRVPLLGTLTVGAPADVAVLELVEKPVEFVDTMRNTRKGKRYLRTVHTIRAGRPFGRPYPQPFSYP